MKVLRGRIFSEIQSYFKMIKNRGVLLAIASKNEEKIALEGLKQKKSILKISDFVTTRINWRDKSENILSIAKEINLSLDSFVFVDDNPSERDLVRKKLPEVSVPEIGQDPEEFIKKINNFLNLKDLNLELISEPKIDGISATLIYKKGVLTNGLSRGDGDTGEDILNNLKGS